MADLLNSETIQQELSEISGWQHNDGSIARTWELKGFNGAVQLANVVALVANSAKHHPDISVHDYNKVTVTATTHDAGGVTSNDIGLARRINATLEAAG